MEKQNEITAFVEKIISDTIEKTIQKFGIKLIEPMKNSNVNELFTLHQLCEYLHVKPPTIYALTSKKSIPFYKKGKKLYFKKSEIDKWLETGRVLTNAELDAVTERIQRNPGGRNA